MNIAVIGFRGTGKTTVCRLLSERLGYKLISTDEEIIKYTKMTIQGVIKKFGWDKLRDRETEVVEKICDYDDCIFDTGGGLVMRNENIVSLKKCSVIVLLTCDARTIMKRIKESKPKDHKLRSDFLEEITKVMKEREQKYKSCADYAIDTTQMTPEEATDLIHHYCKVEMQ